MEDCSSLASTSFSETGYRFIQSSYRSTVVLKRGRWVGIRNSISSIAIRLQHFYSAVSKLFLILKDPLWWEQVFRPSLLKHSHLMKIHVVRAKILKKLKTFSPLNKYELQLLKEQSSPILKIVVYFSL